MSYKCSGCDALIPAGLLHSCMEVSPTHPDVNRHAPTLVKLAYNKSGKMHNVHKLLTSMLSSLQSLLNQI